LNAKNQVKALNTYAIPVVTYPAGIIKWTEETIKETDIATWKLLTMHGALHPKSSTTRLYHSRKYGGRGLISVKQAVHREEQSMIYYATALADKDKLLAEFHSMKQVDQSCVNAEIPEWHTGALHSVYHTQVSEVGDLHQTYQWLSKCDLTANTESLIMAAQEQALPTRQLQAHIYRTRDDPRCRLCKESPETVQHIISGCKQVAGVAYTERHNNVAGVVYRGLCTQYGLNQPQHWWETPNKVNENSRAKILWDYYIQTDKHVLANQPDIIVVDKEEK
jgi:hypothetical protein